MEIRPLEISGVLLIRPERFEDHRGSFAEVYNRRRLAEHGVTDAFVQDNHSWSRRAGTVRGLHFQTPPHAQSKLVRVIRGEILDVVVDLRPGSPSYARHCTARLSAADGWQIYVPVGFAHGFCTLAPETEVVYKVGGYFSREHDAGILWSDPALGIDWPVAPADAVLSDKDRRLPRLADIEPPFGRA